MEEVIKDLYSVAQSKGYAKSEEEFTNLLYNNDDVFSDMYSHAQSNGYTKSSEDFASLVGKKKDFSEPKDTGLNLENGLSEQLMPVRKEVEETIPPAKSPDKINKYIDALDKDPLIKEGGVSGITTELLEKKESFIVPQLNYLYGDQGFVFEEADITGQKIKVTARNGVSEKFDIGLFQNESQKAEDLKRFIVDNKKESSNIIKKEFGYKQNKLKFESDEQFEKTNERFSNEAQELQNGYDLYIKNSNALEKEIALVERMSEEELVNNQGFVKDLNERIIQQNVARENLENATEGFKQKEIDLNEATGKYFAMKEMQGSLGGLGLKKLKSGVLRIASENVQLSIDAATKLIPLELQMGRSAYREELIRYGKEFGYGTPSNIESLSTQQIEEFYNKDSDKERMVTAPFATEKVTEKVPAIEIINDKIRDDNRKQLAPISDVIREDVLEEWTNKSVSEQYEAAKTEGFWGGAIYGLIESLPALVSPNQPTRLANLYSLTASFVDEEMANNPMFDDVPESEKATLKSVIAIPSAALENIGFRNIFEGKSVGIIQKVLAKALGRTPKGAAPSTLRQYILEEVSSPAVKAALTVTGAAATEFETGLSQQITEDVVKMVYNDLKQKDYFETPDTGTEFLLDALYAGAQEAVGGFILGVPNAISNAYSNESFNELTPQQLAAFQLIKKDPKISETAFTNKLKSQINSGEITTEQAKQIKADYKLAIGLSKSVPENLDDTSYLMAMNLLVKKQKIKEATGTIDENLKKNDLKEIEDINFQLERLKEKPVSEDVVEETLDEVFAEPTPTKKLNATKIFFGDTAPKTTEVISDNLVINTDNAPESRGNIANITVDLANKAATSIKGILPNTKIILHDSKTEFEKYAPAGKGYFDQKANIIHVNLETAKESTVPHEVFHAVIVNKLSSEPEIEAMAKSMMNSVRKALPKNDKLAIRIDQFVAAYDNDPDLQSEEGLAELMGIMASEYTRLNKPQKNKIIKFFQDIAKKLGLNFGVEFTKSDADVIELMNTLSGKVATGEEIIESDVDILVPGTLVPNANGVIPSNIKESDRKIGRQQKNSYQINRGGIDMSSIKYGSINDLSGATAFVYAADKSTYGLIKSPSGLEFNFYGGYLYPYGSGYGWAFTDKNNAQKVLNKVKESDGIGLVMLQGDAGITGSFTFFQYLNAEIAHAINKGASPSELLNYVNEKLSIPNVKKVLEKKGKPLQLTNLKQLNTLMPFETTEGNEKFSYGERSTFTKAFFSATAFDKFGIPPLKPTSKSKVGVLDYVNDPNTKEVEYGDIVSAIQFDKNSGIIEVREGDPNYHPSYPFTISGKPLMVFNKAVDVRLVFPDAVGKGEDASPVPIGKRPKRFAAKSAMGGQFVGKVPEKIRQQKETPVRQQRDIKQVAEMFNMNTGGFITSQANERELKQMTAPLGYEVRKSGYNQFGQGGDYFLVKDGKKYKPPRLGRQQKDDSYYSQKVKEARSKGIKDSLIYDYLRRKEKLSVEKIKKLFEIDSILLGVLPESFKSIEGGANAGLKLFIKIEKQLGDIRRKNTTLKEPLSEREITDQLFEFFMDLPEYKKVADQTKMSTTQAQLLIDLQKALDEKISTELATQLKNARQLVRQTSRGVKEVKKLQQELINFMRRNLPSTSFTKSEAINLVRKIQQVNPKTSQKNIKNLMDEVMDVVTSKTNDYLLKKINNILVKKYETKQAGRKKAKGIDVDTNTRIQQIKNSILNIKSDPELIRKQILSLEKELEVIGLNEESTQADMNKAGDIQIALNYNMAMLEQTDDLDMTDYLSNALSGLETVVKGGKMNLQRELELANAQYRKELEIAWEEITGQKVDMLAPDYKEVLTNIKRTRKSIKNKEKSANNLKKFAFAMRDILTKMNDTVGFGSAEALDGLMDRLSKMPGDMFGGRLQELVTDKIDAATRKFKERMLKFDSLLRETMKEYYGDKWPKLFKEFEQTDNEFYYNKKEVDDAEAAFNKNKNDQTLKAYNDAVEKNVFVLSQHQMAYYVSQFKDPALASTFKRMYGPSYVETMKDMESKLDERVKKFAEWQVEVYYPSVYEYYNSIYRQIYRTNMPFNRYYAGPLYREGTEQEPIDLLGNMTTFNTSVGSTSTKFRVNDSTPLEARSVVNTMLNYTRDMEYFAAYSLPVRSIHKIFHNKFVEDAIIDIHGARFNKLIKDAIEKIATRGVNKSFMDSSGFFNFANTVFLVSRLGLNPAIALKQLTSIPTYANDIGPLNWIKYSVKNKGEQIKLWKEVRDNSVYMKDRKNDGILKVIEAYNPEAYINFVPDKDTKNWTVDFLMAMIKRADRTAIMLGGLPNYSYYKAQFKKNNPNATEQEAIDYAIIKFEKDTKRTQQSTDLQDKDIYQNRSPIYRMFNMFLTTPKQYLRKEIQATRSLYRKLSQWD